MIRVEATSPVRKLCPYKEEIDDGTVTLVFDVADGDAPELHRLAADLRVYADEPVSHEAFTADLLRVWQDHGCIEVRSTWQTAGFDVTVKAVP